MSQLQITKKADIYLESDNKEIRIALSFPQPANMHDMIESIFEEIEKHVNENVKLRSIYFSEERKFVESTIHSMIAEKKEISK